MNKTLRNTSSSLWLMSLAILFTFLGSTADGVGLIDFGIFLLAAAFILSFQNIIVALIGKMFDTKVGSREDFFVVDRSPFYLIIWALGSVTIWYSVYLIRIGYVGNSGVIEAYLPLLVFINLSIFGWLVSVSRWWIRRGVRIAGITLIHIIIIAITLGAISQVEILPESVVILSIPLLIILHIGLSVAGNSRSNKDAFLANRKIRVSLDFHPVRIVGAGFLILNGYFFSVGTTQFVLVIFFLILQLIFLALLLVGPLFLFVFSLSRLPLSIATIILVHMRLTGYTCQSITPKTAVT